MRYFQIRNVCRLTLNPLPNFEEHFTTLAYLLRAFGELAGKPEQWSEDVIDCWNRMLLAAEADEDELEHPLLRVLNECVSKWPDTSLTQTSFTYEGVAGQLFVTEAAELLTFLQKLNLRHLNLPKTPQGLSRRLKSCTFQTFTFLPTDTPGVPELKRISARRPIGFFRPDPMTP
jgi:hypothetical protein